jgi:hypothetical protein
MAIFASLFALLGRFVGRILTTTLGWASTLLFGQVPQSRQVWLAALTFGSLVWVALVAGVIVPSVGTFLLAFAPLPDWVDRNLVRLAMLAAAILLPAVLGGVTLLLAEPGDRPKGRELVATVLRGYLLAPALAATLVLLAVVGTIRRADSLIHRRQDAHIAMIVRPGHYEALVATIRRALEPDGLVTTRRPGPSILTAPAKLLATVAGGGMRRLVPDELAELRGPRLIASVYPSDLALSGHKEVVAEARALVTRDLRSADAWFTTSREAQAVEDRMTTMERDGHLDPTSLHVLDETLLRLTVPQEEWEVLYRRRLQLVDGGEADLGGSGARPGGVERTERWDLGTLIGVATTALLVVDVLVLASGLGRRAAYRAGFATGRRSASPRRWWWSR